jgi:hypothetical protein
MQQETAADFYDELQEAIRLEKPIKLVHVGMLTDEQTLLKMWDEGSLCL